MLVILAAVVTMLLFAVLYLIIAGDSRARTITVTTRNLAEGQEPPDHILITFLRNQDLRGHFDKHRQQAGRS